ncbi:hypothetical protein Acr_07g0015560 [Actinidia rufa]|uniref:Uncharacterized protein n=1 Tax=Actinidia rufa TaxID=165716 RepID=A0A7J0EY54_9ERIC|nr:hypothetical protein Acr_07g0015560 [Actinidia rufa]
MSTVQIKVSRRLVAELDDDEDSNDSLVATLTAAGSSRQRKFVPDDLASQISSLQASIETMSISMTGNFAQHSSRLVGWTPGWLWFVVIFRTYALSLLLILLLSKANYRLVFYDVLNQRLGGDGGAGEPGVNAAGAE